MHMSVDLELARAKQEALRAIARPIPRERGPVRDYGDGDRCPTHPDHGHMYVEGQRQYCPHHDHDDDHSRCFWPLYMKDPLPDLPELEI